MARCTAAHFKNMRMVFDTTFCGILAADGDDWGRKSSMPSMRMRHESARGKDEVEIWVPACFTVTCFNPYPLVI